MEVCKKITDKVLNIKLVMVLEAVGRGGRVYSNATASNKPSVSDTLGGVFVSLTDCQKGEVFPCQIYSLIRHLFLKYFIYDITSSG